MVDQTVDKPCKSLGPQAYSGLVPEVRAVVEMPLDEWLTGIRIELPLENHFQVEACTK